MNKKEIRKPDTTIKGYELQIPIMQIVDDKVYDEIPVLQFDMDCEVLSHNFFDHLRAQDIMIMDCTIDRIIQTIRDEIVRDGQMQWLSDQAKLVDCN